MLKYGFDYNIEQVFMATSNFFLWPHSLRIVRKKIQHFTVGLQEIPAKIHQNKQYSLSTK